MSLDRGTQDDRIHLLPAIQTREQVLKLIGQLRANKAGMDGKRDFRESHNPAVREIAGGYEVLLAVLESLLGRPENLHQMRVILYEE